MFDDLPPDLDRLHTLRVWHSLCLRQIDARIAEIRRRQAEEEHGRRVRPEPPEWIVELGIGTGRPPVRVHSGTCHLAGTRRRPITREEARRLLTADGLPACAHCEPDVELRIIELSTRTRPGRGHATENKDPPHEHHRAAPGRTRPLRAHLPRRPGRPLRGLSAQDPQVRPRRHTPVPVVHGTCPGQVGKQRTVRRR
ncbi:DUF6233 domain-containing protein [Streptomyces sp. NPDC058739]|uniref:DUF6233 domain-containing protein n=1 Tax=Streptomyces sp. NPDC058739 TaxID=3346618 RepID=UPI0036ACD185